jgi:hypothetical protein
MIAQFCQLQVMPFTHSAFVWQACADAWLAVAEGAGKHSLPWVATSWQAVPAVAVPSSATAQQTLPVGQSDFSTQPNDA